MAGSRRRLKKTLPKVRVGVQKREKKTDKSHVPLEVREGRPSMAKRQLSVDWREGETLTANYANNRLVMDPNADFACNRAGQHRIKSAEERRAEGEEAMDDDDELRAGCNLERKAGKAPPPRLTSQQTKVVEQLISKHGEDVDAMVLDTKLNKMQHSAGKLKQLIAGHTWWQGAPPEQRKHDFRGPQKQYKRL